MPHDKRRKIALIIAGGASLGSYESGVLTELLYALDYLNQTATREEDKFVIDVMTGGSAGALAAVLMARIMFYDLPGLRRILYNAWVERINIMDLMEDAPDNALLSKDLIRQIARDYVVTGSSDGTSVKAPASFAPDVLQMGLTLSNMHGMDYIIPYLSSTTPGDRAFISTVFADQAHFQISRKTMLDESLWAALADTAIASGSFPIAFQPEAIFRSRRDYPQAEQGELGSGFFPPSGVRPMTFLDGGIFNNEPLQDAIQLARRVDGGVADPERIFLLVDPSINRSEFEATITPAISLEGQINRLLEMILSESRAVEWLKTAYAKNVELTWRNELIRTLTDLVKNTPPERLKASLDALKQVAQDIVQENTQLATAERGPDSPNTAGLDRPAAGFPAGIATGTTTGSLAGFSVGTPAGMPPGANPEMPVPTGAQFAAAAHDPLSQSFHQLETQFPEEFQALASDSTQSSVQQEFLKYLFFVLNATSRLDNKSIIKLSLIGSIPEKTAGDQISGFGGFFEEEWRQFDYRQGRIEAHKQLPKILGDRYPREQVNGRPSEEYRIPPEWENFASVTMDDADRSLRKDLRRIILKRTANLIGGVLKVPLSGWLASRFLIRPKINDLLKL